MYGSTIALGFGLVSAIIGAAGAAGVPNIVYRGDHRSPAIIHKQGGFFARGYAVGVEPDPKFPYHKHVEHNPFDPENLKSPFLSVSSRRDIAQFHIRHYMPENNKNYVYVYHINTTGVVKQYYHDVNALYAEDEVEHTFSYENEFLSDHPILWRTITGWDVVNPQGVIKETVTVENLMHMIASTRGGTPVTPEKVQRILDWAYVAHNGLDELKKATEEKLAKEKARGQRGAARHVQPQLL
ncbi:hypothetical protein MCOR21_008154 [Pyricularia oryzae]|nr:hypothetical protein MCOR19_001400 [Pyricularia oryzae]KAI6273588.1 hypothetical protein MCOR26_006833 [Pyricularia oryzae]KAI6339448.1 hypothetical protein MCOR28_007280 [Pyricularia oryzae]KAI6381196.1 hypothetical protein MCOR32_003652 [Pyricularia oryzae]KAI6423481.1 hypothetical protein MCOR21_008154 [Pyricularia oryzae]